MLEELRKQVLEPNLELVRRVASRDLIRPRVIEFYEWLAGRV